MRKSASILLLLVASAACAAPPSAGGAQPREPGLTFTTVTFVDSDDDGLPDARLPALAEDATALDRARHAVCEAGMAVLVAPDDAALQEALARLEAAAADVRREAAR